MALRVRVRVAGRQPVSEANVSRVASMLAILGGIAAMFSSLLVGAIVVFVAHSVYLTWLTLARRANPQRRFLGALLVPRAMIAATVGGIGLGLGNGWLVISAALLGVGVVIENSLRPHLTKIRPLSANVPGLGHVETPVEPRLLAPLGWQLVLAAVMVACVVQQVVVGIVAVLLSLAVLAALLTCGVRVVRSARAYRRESARLPTAIADLAPRYVLYWDAPIDTTYQVAMWIPLLESLDGKLLIVLRNPATLPELAEKYSSSMVVLSALTDLDYAAVPSVTVAFYVNNASRNTHFVRFPDITHVQLNHGDSDKAPSYSPVMRMYDFNFVAGPVAIDRFANHGIRVRDGFFRVVGRPQEADVERADRNAPGVVRSVLYAPTWAGFNVDSHYSSLPVAEQVIRKLLERGVRVVFRPHPYTDKSEHLRAAAASINALLAADRAQSGRQHRLSDGPHSLPSLTDDFNAVDALLTDVSSVASSFLATEKPLAIFNRSVGSRDEFIEGFPVAAAAYVIDFDVTNADRVLDDLLISDSLHEERLRLMRYYLGDIPRSELEEHFRATVAEIERPDQA